jgi:hypothetical protein
MTVLGIVSDTHLPRFGRARRQGCACGPPQRVRGVRRRATRRDLFRPQSPPAVRGTARGADAQSRFPTDKRMNPRYSYAMLHVDAGRILDAQLHDYFDRRVAWCPRAAAPDNASTRPITSRPKRSSSSAISTPKTSVRASIERRAVFDCIADLGFGCVFRRRLPAS